MPAEWPIVKLGSIADIKIGGTPSRERSEFWADAGTGLPWVSISDLRRRVVSSTHETITVAGARRSNTKLVPAGTVLMSFKLSIGRVAYSGTDLYTNEAIAAFYPAEPLLAKEWLYHLLPRVSQSNNIDQAIKGATLNKHKLNQLEIPLPPLPEQRRIAEILDTLDRTIEGTQRVIEKLQAARQGLLHDLLTRGLDERDHLRDPERHPEQFHDTELGRLPVGWMVSPLIQVATLQRGFDLPHHVRQEGRVPVYGSNGLDGWHNATPLEGPTVITGRKGTIGTVFYSEVPCLPLSTALYVKDFHGNDPEFVTLLLRRLNFKRFIAATGLPSLNRNFVHPTLVAVPDVSEQKKIVERVDVSETRLDAEMARLAKLQALKRGLMDDLLTGRVRVGVAESQVEDHDADSAVHTHTASPIPTYIPPTSTGLTHALFRAGAGADPAAMTAWTQQLQAAVQHQAVGAYSDAALDAALPQLLALAADRRGLLGVPEVLASAGVRFMVCPHPKGSRMSGAAFYLDEPGRTQPVVGLSLLRPFLDTFWFNLLHELGHLRLGHEPVLDESLEPGEYDPDSAAEQAANDFARRLLIPEANWRPFLAAGQHDSNQVKRFAGRLGRHPAVVAGRLAHETGDWARFNSPTLRPTVRDELHELAALLSTQADAS